MPLSPIKLTIVKQTVARYVETRRPPKAVRDIADVGYRASDEEVVIFTTKASYADPNIKEERPIARATYCDDESTWKVYWSRADGKWHSYDHNSQTTSIDEFVNLVSEDKYGKFWG